MVVVPIQNRDERDPGARATRIVACGHSNRPFAEFLALLQGQGVQRLVDIRRHPGSRTVPWAGQEVLAQALAQHGIAYRHEPELGGRRKPLPDSVNTAWHNEQFRGYADHMATPAFHRALERLLAEARAGQVAVMCSEAVPWRCHRNLLADALVARGVEVVQAIDARHAAPHKVTPFARIRDGEVWYPGEAASS